MRLLLDTHFVIWLVADGSQLTAREREVVTSPNHQISVSAISLWELRVKADAERRRGRVGALSPGDALAFLQENHIDTVAPSAHDYAAVLAPPLDHSDPFDEMLLTHAQQLGAKLLTRDSKLRDHPLALVP